MRVFSTSYVVGSSGFFGQNRPTTADRLKDALRKFVAGEPSLLDEPRLLDFCAGAVRGLLVEFARSNEGSDQSQNTLRLDRALSKLQQGNPRCAKVAELRLFGGLDDDEIAAILSVGPRTVRRDWLLAGAWIHRELGGSDDGLGGTVGVRARLPKGSPSGGLSQSASASLPTD